MKPKKRKIAKIGGLIILVILVILYTRGLFESFKKLNTFISLDYNRVDLVAQLKSQSPDAPLMLPEKIIMTADVNFIIGKLMSKTQNAYAVSFEDTNTCLDIVSGCSLASIVVRKYNGNTLIPSINSNESVKLNNNLMGYYYGNLNKGTGLEFLYNGFDVYLNSVKYWNSKDEMVKFANSIIDTVHQ